MRWCHAWRKRVILSFKHWDQYCGFYNIREKINEHFLDDKIDVSKGAINLLEEDAEIIYGSN